MNTQRVKWQNVELLWEIKKFKQFEKLTTRDMTGSNGSPSGELDSLYLTNIIGNYWDSYTLTMANFNLTSDDIV